MTTATATREKPILFSMPMVQALLDGRKTMTRRIVKFDHKPWLNPLPVVEYARDGMPIWFSSPPTDQIRQSDYFDEGYPCQYGRPGDRLWVRETWNQVHCVGNGAWIPVAAPRQKSKARLVYGSGAKGQIAHGGPWRSPIHMPRWASRITLELTGVRVERLHDITEDDAIAEGVPGSHVDGWRRDEFRVLWDSINGKGSWKSNPWVWAIEFRRIDQ